MVLRARLEPLRSTAFGNNGVSLPFKQQGPQPPYPPHGGGDELLTLKAKACDFEHSEPVFPAVCSTMFILVSALFILVAVTDHRTKASAIDRTIGGRIRLPRTFVF